MIGTSRQYGAFTIIESMAWFAFRPSRVSLRWILFKISLATVSKGFILPSALWMISVESSLA